MIVTFKYRSLFRFEFRVTGKLLSIWTTGKGPFKATKFRVATPKGVQEFKLHYVAQKDMSYMKECIDAELYLQGVFERMKK